MPYDLFQSEPVTNQGRVILPEFLYLKGQITRQIARIEEYYRGYVTDVPNEHLVVRFLLSLNANPARDLRSYADRVADIGFVFSNTLGMTSSINYGRAFTPGVFYGKKTTEIIIAHTDEFDYTDVDQNWRTARPIVVHRHPFTDMGMGRCDGNYESREAGLAVISINLAMLAVQYRAWLRDEGVIHGTGVNRRIHQFVSMFPITNMLQSHVEIALMNRMIAYAMYDDVAAYRRVHPIGVHDFTDRVDSYIVKELQLLERKPLNFDQVVDSIPALEGRSLRQVLHLPNMASTRQVIWALILARLPILRLLLRLNALTDRHQNSWYIQRLSVWLRAFQSDKTLQGRLPLNILHDVDEMIHRDISTYLDRRG